MNKIKFLNRKAVVVASATLLLLFSLLSYVSAPTSDSFIQAINPISSIMGILFALNYLGIPLILSILLLIILLAGMWIGLVVILNKII